MINYNKSVLDQIEYTMIVSGVLKKRGVPVNSVSETMKEYKQFIQSSIKKTNLLQKNILTDVKRKADRLRVGEMYCFAYPVPKYRDTLPFYDQIPVVICTEVNRNGFEGVNIHYFPIEEREKFFKNIVERRTAVSFGEQTRFKMPMEVDIGYRSYLKRKVFSSIIHIRATDWFSALYLPIQKFYGRRWNA